MVLVPRSRRGVPISVSVKRRAKTAVWLGESRVVVAERFSISTSSLATIMNDALVCLIEPVRRLWELSGDDRETISLSIRDGMTNAQIARVVGCHRSTIGREIDRNGGRVSYRAMTAERATCRRAARPKPTKLENHPALAAAVEARLVENWSPAQISAKLRLEFPDDETMRVSAETIYLSIYVHARGALKAELAKHLRTQRQARKQHRSTTCSTGRDGPIRDRVMIVDRPEEIEDRLVPGHWEGDLIVGANNQSQIATLVERSTGFALLIALPDGRDAVTVSEALARQVATLPDQACKSITWDQGSEMADHAAFTTATDIAVYFCDPHAPWQRGTNENFNGLLRQYFPKGTDLSGVTQEVLDLVARQLNDRPRKRFDFLTPFEMFNKLMLH